MKIYQAIRLWLAIKIKWVRPYFLNKEKQEKILLVELRSAFKFFGFNTSDMSDEDIKKGVDEMSRVMAKAGLTKDEAIELSNRMSKLYPAA